LRKRVLVVEDEQLVADLVADALDLEGHEIRCTSGERALDEAIDFHPDVMLLDLMMPVVDGFEVARRFRTCTDTRNIPIVVMTAMHDPEARAVEIGTPHVLAKPFDIAELLDIVERANSPA
jgi:two-component system, OmpR family, alkaline phosphatase synthesis response regulator PhoP